MYQTGTVFSKNYVFQNPTTGEYASYFIHNIKVVIVTNDIVINTNENIGRKTLEQMGFTTQVHDGHGDVRN